MTCQWTLSGVLGLHPEQMARAEKACSGALPAIAAALRCDDPAGYPPAKALVDLARVYLRDADAHLFRASCTIRGERGWRFLLGCSFFRAMDNMTDSDLPAAQQESLIGRYAEITRADVDPQSIAPADVFELIVLVYMALERDASPRTLDCLHDIIRSLRLDLDRRHTILHWDEYEALNHYRAVRPMEAFFRLALNREDDVTREVAWHLGTFAIYIDDIRDLEADMALGFINVTREELDALGVEHVQDMTGQQWQTFLARRNALLLEHSQACLRLADLPEIAPVRSAVQAAIESVMARVEEGGFQVGQAERWSTALVQKMITDQRR